MSKRRKNPEDNKLPSKVYRNKYSYYYKPNSKQCITLCPISANMVEVWAKYNHEIAKEQYHMTFRKLWALFVESAYFSELSRRTQIDYKQHSKKLFAVFGHVNVDNIKTVDIRKFMDKRGVQSKTQANHEFSSMSKVYNWGYERGYAKGNPCKGVTKFTLKARDKYAEDEEYYAILEVARPSIRIAMEIAYLCAMRVGDILKINYSQVLEDGLFAKQGKTGTKQIKLWTDRLREVFEYARKKFPPQNKDSLLILNSNGDAYSYKNFNEHWNEDKKEAEKKLGKKITFTFHDLKAKGISDFDGSSKDKQLFSGHKTESQVLVYDRSVKKSPTLNLPKVTK